MEKCFKGSGSERRGRKGRRWYEARGIEFGRASESSNGEGSTIVMSGLPVCAAWTVKERVLTQSIIFQRMR